MRTITIVVILPLMAPMLNARPALAQEQLGLAALSRTVAPQREGEIQSTRTYTNADLKMRPMPTPPATPPFPEIAPPRWILEHQPNPVVDPRDQPPALEQYGIPLWDDGYGVFGFPYGQGGFKGQRRPSRNYQNAPDPFTPFRRPDVVHFSANGDFSKPSTPSAVVPSGKRGSQNRSTAQPGRRGGSPSRSGGRGKG